MAEESDKEIAPDQVSKEQAIKDLTSSLHINEGGWNPEGNHGTLKRRRDDGRWIITYTVDAKKPYGKHIDQSTDHRMLNKAQMEALEHALNEIEQVTNIKFKRVVHVDQVNKADIRIFQAAIDKNYNASGYARSFHKDAVHEVVISDKYSKPEDLARDKFGYEMVTHEILHALGLSHPGANGKGGEAGGKNPLYTDASTLLSYRNDDDSERSRFPSRFAGLGPYDVAALQYVYGEPHDKKQQSVLTLDDIVHNGTVYSKKSVTLDLKSTEKNYSKVDMDLSSPNFDQQLKISEVDPTTGKRKSTLRRIDVDTQIENVLLPSESTIQLTVTGNKLRNKLQGGAHVDALIPYGGNDTLTGGGGNDQFIIMPHSGFGNIITDFQLDYNKDSMAEMIVVEDPAIKRAKLYTRDDYKIDGVPKSGTEIIFMGDKNTPVSSLFVVGIKPEEIQSKITSPEFNVKLLSSEIIQSTNTNQGHPSGLPDKVQKSPKQPGQTKNP